MNIQAKSKRLILVLYNDLKNQNVTIYNDLKRFKLVLINLISNALKYTSKDTGVIKIKISRLIDNLI